MESFRGRCRPSCKIVLALLQPPRAEPSNADERLQSLRKAGDLDSKSLFVLQTERSNGDSRVEEADARRLDHALLESKMKRSWGSLSSRITLLVKRGALPAGCMRDPNAEVKAPVAPKPRSGAWGPASVALPP